MKNEEQQHPLYKGDRQIVDTLLQEKVSNYNLTELARLRIRYLGFPGAKDIKEDLDKVLKNWQMNEEELFETTRKIHAKGQVFKTQGTDTEDWA